MMSNQNIGLILLGWLIIIFAIINSVMSGIGIFLYLTNPSENISTGSIFSIGGHRCVLIATFIYSGIPVNYFG